MFFIFEMTFFNIKTKHMNYKAIITYLPFLFLFSLWGTNLQSQTTEELLEKASDLYDEKKYDEMLEVAEEVLKKDADNAKGHNYKGIYYDLNQDTIKAKEEYEIANRLDQNFSAPWGNLASIYIDEGKYDLALDYLRKYCAIKPEDAESWTSLAFGFLSKGVIDSTIFYCKKAIELDEKEELAYVYQAYALVNLNQIDEAIESLNQLISFTPSANNYGTRGDFKLSMNDINGAFNDYNKALKEAPDNVEFLSKRAETLFYQEEYEKSKNDALKVLTLDKQNERSIYFLGWSELELGNKEEAFRLANLGLENPTRSYNFHYLLGNYYWRTQNYSKCKDSYTLASDFAPFNSEMVIMKARGTVFENMDMTDLNFNDGDYVFSEIKSNNTKTMDKWVKDDTHKYSYKNLLEKYNNDYTSLSLDEYFMLYYGATSRDDYSPYATDLIQKALGLDSLFEIGKIEEVVSVCDQFLKEKHFIIEPYFYAASAYAELGNKEKYDEYTFKGNMFMESILATGDGKSFENAYVVIAVTDEYNIRNYLGLSTIGQALFHKNGHSYDGLKLASQNESKNQEEQYIYFNIDKPYYSLGEMTEDKSDKKKKKKKRKKRRKN